MNTTSENAKPASKAGRNLPAAIGVGVSFGLVLVLGLFIQPVLVAFAAVAAGIGVWEVTTVLNTRRGYGIPAVPLGILSTVSVACGYAAGFGGLWLAVGVTLLLLLLASYAPRADRRVSPLRSWAGGLLAVLWIPLMLGTAMVYFRSEHGVQGILMILLMAISNDTFGYIAGVNWGQAPHGAANFAEEELGGPDRFLRRLGPGRFHRFCRDGFALVLGYSLRRGDGDCLHRRRPGGIRLQAPHGCEGHVEYPTRPRRHDGPPRLGSVRGRRRLPHLRLRDAPLRA